MHEDGQISKTNDDLEGNRSPSMHNFSLLPFLCRSQPSYDDGWLDVDPRLPRLETNDKNRSVYTLSRLAQLSRLIFPKTKRNRGHKFSP